MNSRLLSLIVFVCLFVLVGRSQTYNIATLNGQTINTCSGSFTDSNGSGSYSNNENYSITFCSSSGLPLLFDFSDPISNPPFFDIDCAGDTLFVYNGTTATGNPIAILTNSDDNTQTTYSSQLQIATNSTCVTFKWKSNASCVDAGWNASISCVSPPTCSGNPPAADIFGQATPICNLNNYCGSTATYYGEDTPYNLIGGGTCPATDDGIFGGTIENNSWLSFQAVTTSASFDFTVSNCGGGGIQVGIFGFSNNTFSLVSPCATTDGSQGGTFTVNATGLTAGNNYYIMIDGNSGANCDYTIHANTGVATVNAGPDQTVCNTNATLAANNPVTGTGVWTVVSGSGVFANASSPTSTVSGLSNGANVFQWTIPSGLCANVSDNVTITVSGAVAAAAAGSDIIQCNNSSFTMSANTPAAGSTGSWSVISGSVSPATSTNPVQTFTLTGTTATLQWSITTPGCGTTTDNIIITNNTGTTPITGFSYTTPVCANASNPSPTNIAGFTTGGTYSSTAGLNINSANGVINLAASTPATYTVTYSVAASGCNSAGSSTASIVITPTTTPTTGFSYPTPVCANASNPSPTGLAGFTTGGTYSSTAGLSINAGTGEINLTASTPSTYTVTYSVAASGCITAGSSTASILINPTTTPTTGFSYTSPICLNAGGTPTPTTIAGFTTGGTYSSTAGLTINSSTGAITLASSSAGTYTITYSVAASGCQTAGTNTASITLTNGGAPTTGFSYNSPVCANASNPSPTIVAGFTTGGTYSSNAGLNINASTGVIDLATSIPSTYTVTYSVTASGCSIAGSNTTSIVITQTTSPTTGFSYASPFCLSSGITPTPTTIAGFTTGGTYSSTAGLTINSSTGAITLASSSAGTYTVTYSVAASGCQTAGTSTASITLTNGGAPTTGFSYATPFCANVSNPSPIIVAGFTTGGTYSSGAGLSVNASTGVIDLATSTPSTYTVTYSVAASGCITAGSSTASIVITPTTSPTTGFSYISPICLNGGSTPTPTTVAGFTTGGTYSSTAGLTINSSTGAITLASSSAGTYTVTYTVAASGCQTAGTNTVSITLTNNGTPTTGFSYTSPVCVNASNPSPTAVVGFTAGGTYSSAAGLSINSSTGVIDLATSIPATYTVTYSVAASGCTGSGTGTTQLTINDVPNIPSINAIDTVCSGSTNTLSIINPEPSTNYNWAVNGGAILNGNGTSSISSLWNGSGPGTISINSTNNCGTTTTIENLFIITATINQASNITICKGESVPINVSGNASSYIWSPATGLNSATITNPIASPLVTTQYIVSSQGICLVKDTITINVLQPIKPSFTIVSENDYANTPFYFINTTNVSSMNYTWSFSDSEATINQYNTSHTYSDTGYYTIILTSSNSLNCSDTTIRHIKIIEEPAIYVPNTFSPNNDYINQIFKPEYSGYTRLEGIIYNRWGEKIYEWDSISSAGWDGKINNRDAQEDVYIYVLKAYTPDNKSEPTKILSGNVNLIR